MMMRSLLRLTTTVALLCCLLAAGPAVARDWTKELLHNETSYDFGAVARGAKAEHHFVIENNNEEDITILSATSSCGCTSVKLTKQVLKSWEKAELIATLDSRSEPGAKDATITVTFAAPFTAELQIHVHATIRGDVVVQPGAAEFGVVKQGEAAERKLTVSYAIGRPDWRITAIESPHASIEAIAQETSRTFDRVTYDLTVKLKGDAPAGYLRDQLVLVTNDFDQRSSRVPVSVEARIDAALTAQPSPLSLGLAEAGKAVTRPLVIRGREAFHVISVKSSDNRFRCTPPSEASKLQVLPITFLAPDASHDGGRAETKLRIETDLDGKSVIEVNASVQLKPSISSKASS